MKGFSLILVCVVSIYSCQEYQSYYPIGEPNIQTNKSDLIGRWQFVKSMQKSTSNTLNYGQNTIEIKAFNLHEYLIKLVPDSIEKASDVMAFRGFETRLIDTRLANMVFLEGTNPRPEFTIYKFEIIDDSLRFWGISQIVFDTLHIDLSSSSSHRKFIKKNLKSPIWDHEYVYARVRE